MATPEEYICAADRQQGSVPSPVTLLHQLRTQAQLLNRLGLAGNHRWPSHMNKMTSCRHQRTEHRFHESAAVCMS